MTERKPRGMSFETWVDQQIAQARSRGAFEGLAGAGKPLPRRAREQTSYEWALEWARRENGGTEGMLPPGLALRKERDELPGVVAALRSEAAGRGLGAGGGGRGARWGSPSTPGAGARGAPPPNARTPSPAWPTSTHCSSTGGP